jgi:hypothetical protein
MNANTMTLGEMASLKMFSEIQERLNELYVKRANMDKAFTEFLEKYDALMNENPFHPSWQFYREASEKYSKLEYEIKTAKYYLTKNT